MGMRAGVRTILAIVATIGAMQTACGSAPSDSDPPPPAPAPEAGGPAPAVACVVSPNVAPTNAPCALPEAADVFDEALTAIGRDRCSLTFDLTNVAKGLMKPRDKRAMPGFADLLERPLRFPAWSRETAKAFDDALASDMPVSRAIAAAATRLGAPITECPDPALFAIDPSDASPLATAIVEATGADAEPTVAAVAGVDKELQRALAPVVRTIAWARGEATLARGSAKLADLETAPGFAMGVERLYLDAALMAQIDGIDVARIVRAGVVVAIAVESARLGRFANAQLAAIDIATPLGAIVLRGPGADTYAPGSPAESAILVLDTGGDDTYRVPAGAGTAKTPVAIAIDLAGKDTYAYEERPGPGDTTGKRLPSDADGARGTSGLTPSRTARQGAGSFGIGLLFDLGTESDTYRSLALSQGAAVFGVGVLYDAGGDDTFTAEAYAQGAGAWGVGLLLDRAGSDRYLAYSAAQGHGFTHGVGGLIDADGDDVYETDPGDPALSGDALYPNAQLPGKANTAMAQGCGRGTRPDSPEPGFPLPGGLGILRDLRGKDRYATSVFGQACAFGMGIGLLLDGEGDDTYEGLWYVQGSAAHTGLAFFEDARGNDRYDPTYPIAATSIGVGHDFSVGIHLDGEGDDTYRAPGLSLGAGNTNGLGIMINVGGTDTFEGRPPLTLGAASASEVLGVPGRNVTSTIGVFVKASGEASFPGVATATPGGTWGTRANPDPASNANELAIGLHRRGGTARLP